jgi:hypothetical protein
MAKFESKKEVKKWVKDKLDVSFHYLCEDEEFLDVCVGISPSVLYDDYLNVDDKSKKPRRLEGRENILGDKRIEKYDRDIRRLKWMKSNGYGNSLIKTTVYMTVEDRLFLFSRSEKNDNEISRLMRYIIGVYRKYVYNDWKKRKLDSILSIPAIAEIINELSESDKESFNDFRSILSGDNHWMSVLDELLLDRTQYPDLHEEIMFAMEKTNSKTDNEIEKLEKKVKKRKK